jgi:Family of unknown function (DUF6326)
VPNQSSLNLHESKLDTKVVLSGLWVATLFVFAYVDIFAFWRADVINGALAKKVPNTPFEINQRFLIFTTVYILFPSLMVVASLVTRARINRRLNIVFSLLYAASIVPGIVNEPWAYFIIGSLVEIVLLLAITRTAWTWPKHAN